MIESTGERFRLTIPLREAVRFALGESDLSYRNASDELRQLVGFLALDSLEYTEQWRAAAMFRHCFEAKWPRLFE